MLKLITIAGLVVASAAAPAVSSTFRSAPSPLAAGEGEMEVALIFETNVSDGDGEIVLDVESDDAFDRFILIDPMGGRILGVMSNDRESLGLAQFVLESAEPDIDTVLAAYPEGQYTAYARTIDHVWVVDTLDFTHDLVDTPVILSPADGETIPAEGAVVSWGANPEVESWTLEIEQDDLETALVVTLPGSVTSFAIPDGFLVSSLEWELGLAAAGEDGNVIVVESAFVVQ